MILLDKAIRYCKYKKDKTKEGKVNNAEKGK